MFVFSPAAVLRRLWKTSVICVTMALYLQAKSVLMGVKQLGFSDYEITTAKNQTKREKSLSEMEAVVPWYELIELVEPY